MSNRRYICETSRDARVPVTAATMSPKCNLLGETSARGACPGDTRCGPDAALPFWMFYLDPSLPTPLGLTDSHPL
jgi:hypothetical protein